MAFWLGMLANAAASQQYFPPASEQPTLTCGPTGKPYKPIDTFVADWFSKPLVRAGEPALHATHIAIMRSGRNVLRFTWLRSFDPPVVVRIEWSARSSPMLTATELDGAGGYDPGAVRRRVTRRLTSTEVRRLRVAILDARIADAAMAQCDMGCDGAEWIVEAVSRAGYRIVVRWRPEAGEIRALGLLLLGMTKWRVGEVY